MALAADVGAEAAALPCLSDTGQTEAPATCKTTQKKSPGQLGEELHVPTSLSLVVLVAVVVVAVVVRVLAAARHYCSCSQGFQV